MSPKKLLLKTSSAAQVINPDDIQHVSAEGSYFNIVLVNGQKMTLSKNLNSIAPTLLKYDFIRRIHHSFFVNIQRIQEVKANQVLLANRDLLPIARSRKVAFMNCFDQL